MTPYQPNDIFENEVLCGLLTHVQVLAFFTKKGLSPSLFIGQNSLKKQQIVRFVLDYYRLHHAPMPLDLLITSVEAEAEGVDREVDRAATMVTLKKALDTQSSLDGIEHKVLQLVETFKSASFVGVMKEAGGRFMECRFRFKRHELCEDCPVQFDCRGLTMTPGRSFSDNLLNMTQIRLQKIRETSGSSKVVSTDVLEHLGESWQRYEQRERASQQGGPGFIPGVPTPWSAMNQITGGWLPTRLYGIFAERKTGKTTALTTCVDSALLAGKTVLFAHMEDLPPEMVDRFLVSISGISQIDYMLGRLTEQEKVVAQRRIQEYQKSAADRKIGRFISVYAPLRRLGIHNITEKLEELNSAGTPVDLFLFDHLHVADLYTGTRRGASKPELLLDFCEGAKVICQEYRIPGVLAGQLKTSGERKGKARWSDEMEDSFDGVFDIIDENGKMKIVKRYGRYFGDVTVQLDDFRDRARLPQSQDQEDDIIPDDDIMFGSSQYMQ